MPDQYDDSTAFHYRAYRPPLHKVILEQCLGKEIKYGFGLDFGCGTGHSSLALTHYCNQVVGVEPSIEMLQKAVPHPKIRYLNSITNHKEYSTDFFNIITFAGSLFYAKSQAVLDEISRAGKNGCHVVAYDFEISLDDILKKLEIETDEGVEYDHKADFSGLTTDYLVWIKKQDNKTSITFKTLELSHLILSVKGYRLYLSEKYPEGHLVEKLMEMLSKFSNLDVFTFEANLFYSVYRLEK